MATTEFNVPDVSTADAARNQGDKCINQKYTLNCREYSAYVSRTSYVNIYL
jgi:hypothetical protein